MLSNQPSPGTTIIDQKAINKSWEITCGAAPLPVAYNNIGPLSQPQRISCNGYILCRSIGGLLRGVSRISVELQCFSHQSSLTTVAVDLEKPDNHEGYRQSHDPIIRRGL